jgi:hypothetical protein
VERNSKLYDTEDHTFTLTKNVFVDITYFLTWTELPEHVRRYITIMGARIFQKRFLGDGEIEKFTEDDEFKVKRQFIRKESNIADCSIFDNPYINPRVFKRKF